MDKLNQNIQPFDRRSSDHGELDLAITPLTTSSHWYLPSWGIQRLQFVVRYLFAALALVYFNFVFASEPLWMSISEVNLFIVCYISWVSASFYHAKLKAFFPTRFRIAMWVDVVSIAIAVVNDPFIVPLTALVYIVILLGNGMRYGMRFFTETLVACFLTALLALIIRFAQADTGFDAGAMFLSIFGSVILIYAYTLMGHMENSRRIFDNFSKIDPLTGVLNRSAIREATEHLLNQIKIGNGSLIVATVTFPNLPEILDQHDPYGDEQLLRRIASVLSKQIREYDMVSRYADEQFAIILRELSCEHGEKVIQRLRESILSWYEDEAVSLSFSLGISEAPSHGTDFSTLLKHAVNNTSLSEPRLAIVTPTYKLTSNAP